MISRRVAARRTRLLRDRGDAQIPLSPPAPSDRFHSATHYVPLAAAHPPSAPPLTFIFPDPHHHHSTVVLVASFDAHLHHRMRPSPTSPRAFTITIRVARGSYTYKFLVDGVWSVCPSLHHRHPIERTEDGVRHHRLLVPNATAPRTAPQVVKSTLYDTAINPHSTTVFRSASASAVPSPRPAPAQPAVFSTPTPSPSVALSESNCRRTVEVAPRGSSFNTPPPPGSISHTRAVNRKSLLQRVGSGWLKRFSARFEPEGADSSHGSASLSSAHFATRERSGSGLFRSSRERMSLFPSNSEPTVGRASVDDKENPRISRNGAMAMGERIYQQHHQKRGTLRGSTRGAGVKVSRPMKVDEPKDVNEVNRQADNWRQMARHLQNDLYDPTGARELFNKAIEHREKHGLWFTSQNAQVHVDLARNVSKAGRMKDAEFHLRIALRIYNNIEAGKEHIADLMLYVGVVVDRQKRRGEAEDLYRKALGMYKEHGICGNNVEIALKNLSLNLRKQNREAEIERMRNEFACRQGTHVGATV